MPRSLTPALGLALALPCALAATANVDANPALPVHRLDNGTVSAAVTDAIGGRVLSFGLRGQPNFLRVDEAAGDAGAAVDASTGNVGWLGHEVWVGPQKQWWTHQAVNPERAAAHAVWPPDPYLSLAAYTLKEKSASALALASPASPVSGLQLEKRYALVPGKPNSLRLEVDATNRRDSQVAWDLWFNTRAHGDTRVYVPVASAADVRQQPVEGGGKPEPLRYTVADRLLSIDPAAPGQGARRGKLFVQPAAGWMAGFYGAQALVIQFAHQARSAIHPDQGQVELYNEWRPDAPDKSLLEMEVHAPYRKLAPGAAMRAHETWTLLPYAGADTRAAHLAFLRRHARALGLEGL